MRFTWPVLLSVATACAFSPVLAQTESQLKPDFSNVANLGTSKTALKLSAEHMAALKKNLFVVTPGDDLQPFYIYGNNDYLNFSSLITTDNVLQLYHVFFDSTLRHVEQNHLAQEAKRLSVAMLKQAIKRYRSVVKTPLASAALKNIAYFGVADRLLGGKDSIPPAAKSLVTSELGYIAHQQGMRRSAIFPYDLDYSQFIVRGHYTKSKILSDYFKALMWFGLVPLSLERHAGDRVEANPEQVRQATLMVQDLYDSGALKSWQRIYDVTSLYVGDSNNLTPAEWRSGVNPVLGWPQDLSALSSDAKLAEVVSAVKLIAKPKIVSKTERGTQPGDAQFRFMGQRSIPDSIAFNRVTDGMKRPWPSPLDVAAIFGSKRAASILDANPSKYNPLAWSDYVTERDKMAAEVRAWKTADWSRNLYNGSLDLIRLNLAKPTAAEPKFMKSDAWADKSISSSLAFWAELRHDTLLYGEQTAAEKGDGEEQPFVKGYVEPNVPLYERLLSQINAMQSGLSRFGYVKDNGRDTYGGVASQTDEFKGFHDLVTFMLSVSKRELSGGRLTKDEHWRIRTIEGAMESINQQIQLSGEKYAALTADDTDMAEVADVHTSNGQALTVATGHPDDLIAVVPIEGKLYLARGGVLSYYEFKVPVSKRMTDHQWKQIVQAGKAPPRPDWIKSYFVNKSSRGKEN